MEERCVAALNTALTEAFETRDDVYLLGEDVLDPYGGAFKVTQGLSTRWPKRVITTPVSEGAIFGVAAGMALRGWRPVLEIMFGDFIALGFDQTVNGISKFRAMFDDQVRVPLVVRTPMGGRRGYGPTHSQTLEKLLLGVPGIKVVAPSECHDIGALAARGDRRRRPGLLHREQAHVRAAEPAAGGRPARRPASASRPTGRYPALSFSGNGFSGGETTIVTYGGMLPIVLEAAVRLIIEDELFTEVVCLSRLLPLDLEPVLESVARTGSLVTVEEGTLTGGVGAEIAARVQSEAWDDLQRPVERIAARDGIIPAAPTLEEAVLPGVDDVVSAVRALGIVRS